MNRKRHKRKKQNFIVIVTFMLLCLFWNYLIDDICSPKYPDYEYTYKEYVISAGERLWDIAEKELENNTYYKSEDIRQVIYEIQKDNNINSTIYEGQVIKIRIKKDELSNTTDQSELDNASFNTKD